MNLIIEALTGIVKYNSLNNTLYIRTPSVLMDCQAEIPFKDRIIKVDFKGDLRKIYFPDDVNIEYL